MANQTTNPIRSLVQAASKALKQDKYQEVVGVCNKIIGLQDDHAVAYSMLFTSLYRSGELEQARLIGGRAAELNPTTEFILNNQACLQLDANHPAAAAGLLRTLIKQNGKKAKWLYNLGLAQRSVGSYQNAIDIFNQTLDVNPAHARAAFQLADLYEYCGMLELSTRQFNYLRLLRPHHRETRRWYINSAASNGDISEADLHHEIRLWGDKFTPNSKPYPATVATQSNSLKLGFVVGAIPQSWWTSMVAPVLDQLSVHEEVTLYWQNRLPVPAQAEHKFAIVESFGLSDSSFARQVRTDHIEVIIDVCGMRAGCRQRAYGLKLANKQFGWLAHEGLYISEAVTALDKYLGQQRFYFNVAQKNKRAKGASTKKTLFGINCTEGLRDTTVETWAQILQESNGWNLSLDADRPEIVKQLRANFAKYSVDRSHITFNTTPNIKQGAIVLENLANNDVVKVEKALREGATIVALEGEIFQAQQSAALLKQIDKADWIMKDKVSYRNRTLSLMDMAQRPHVSREELALAGIYNVEHFAKRIRKIIRR